MALYSQNKTLHNHRFEDLKSYIRALSSDSVKLKEIKKFWEELTAFFPSIRHGLHREPKILCGDMHIHRQQHDLISLVTKTTGRYTERRQGDPKSLISLKNYEGYTDRRSSLENRN
jgi:exonuclease III